MDAISTASQPRKGRPTREEAEARQGQLLDCAIAHFLERGFERTTIEAVAAEVQMTKRTVYARYPDKETLFRAAVDRAIGRFAIPDEAIAATRADDLAKTLTNIAMLRIDLVSTAEGLALQRIINTESYRFPDIFTRYYEVAALPTAKFLARVLREATEAGELAIDNPALAANAFMSLAVSGPVRLVTSGNPLSRREMAKRVDFAVRLFLDGARARENQLAGGKRA